MFTNNNTTALLTGINGFVGHHVFEHLMKNTDWNIVGLYRDSCAGDWRRIDEVLADHQEWTSRLLPFHHDLRDPIYPGLKQRLPDDISIIIHIGASSHVDRSIIDPRGFMKDNVEGTLNLLEFAREINPSLFVYFSTDEVFGNALGDIKHDENCAHRPRNPYAASKAAAEDFCNAYCVTYKVPIIITQTMNIIGERQSPEKYVPKIMSCILNGQKLSIHAHPDKLHAGQRHYLHARNAAAALLFVMKNGQIGERYNIVGEEEIDNLTLAKLVHEYMETDLPLNYELVDFHSSRPGHDLRYALDGTKLAKMGYTHPVGFRQSLQKTIQWTLSRPWWLT